ncbi:MAG: bifunctional UDP-N-acetylglucosamine diphosphorylase/glucosamine-1-phosphate N-acetyltransferase GlmU [Firmicutes bacterium]|jgi:bifunctional UDP-N-acetylglucosamine pyrophosphorylase/glucosamine-1-phosphate N-acetyltransferase|nr:bifunctional UDP-N-acetylglucosamine diphosphorylase/glucosamine-1-phosphate N-acetyltransferase GlmU [Bacillota bacterium]
MNNLTGIVLSAGAGTRMKSKLPKVLHKVLGRTMVDHVIDVLDELDASKKVVVYGHGKDMVHSSLESRNVRFALQAEQKGTGHAVMVAKEHIGDDDNVLILYGDTPLIRSSSIKEFCDEHERQGNDLSILTTIMENPFGYGRIIREEDGRVTGIVEQKDGSQEQLLIKEINSGIYLVNGRLLKDSLELIENNNNQGEYYLTDIVKILSGQGKKVGCHILEDPNEVFGVNTRKHLSIASQMLQERVCDALMENGVTILNPNNVYIEKNVLIGNDTIVCPGVFITGDTEIGSECYIGVNSRIEDSKIMDHVEVNNSTVLESKIDSYTKVGPYAYLRPKSNVGKNTKIGDFVEIKNSNIGDGTKISHLAYVGDGDVGKDVNIGCGVVFVNYDGSSKSRTVVGDNSFIGCNVNLVAPVEVQENAYVAAGSTITKTVPKDSLGIARERQTNIQGWVTRRKND